jgi:hypothetical protein
MITPRICNKNKHNRFRGHANYQKAHKRILSHPLKSETQYFQTHGFSTDQIFWPLETASTWKSSISSMTDLLRSSWDGCPSGEEVLKLLRDIPETDVEPLCNRLLLAQYQALPANIRQELAESGMLIMDKHEDPYWGDPKKVPAIKGQKQHDSYYHFVYFTCDIVSEHFRFTIYIMPYVEGFTLVKYVDPVVQYVRNIFPVKRIICDGEFPNVDVLLFSDRDLVPWTMRKSKTSAVKNAIQCYIDDPDLLLNPQWHEVEITGGTNHQSIKIHVTAYKLNGIIKVITKPLWDNLSVEDARKLYDKRFKIDGGYKEKHTFQAVTSSRKWSVRLVLFLISVLLWNVWRLALAWDFFAKNYALFDIIPPNLIRKVIAHELGEYLVRVWWRLCD